MKYTKEQIADATERLHALIKPGDKVYTILRQVARSGMSRHISVMLIRRVPTGEIAEKWNGEPRDITGLVALALQERVADDGGLIMSGCGMDMGFETVYRIGTALWPDGFECVGDGCHSNDHFNGDRDYTPHHHTDGGYALRQSWL